MTATTEQALPRTGTDSQPLTLPSTIHSEWIKFTTLRSTVAVLAMSMLGMLVVGLVVGYETRHLGPSLAANDVVASSPLQGYLLGELLVGALGVLYVTGEYSTGMIHSTLIAVPRRMPVLWAKLTVFLTITLSTMVTMSIAAFLAGEAVISHFRAGYSLSDPHALRVVIGTGVYLTLLGLLGLAIGWIVRSTPGALVSYLAVILVVPEILANIAGNPGKHIAEYFPAQAGAALINIIPDGLSTTPWTGITVMAAWTVVFLLTAALTLRLRDA